MPIDPLDPNSFGFQKGSPIFDYPIEARRAINEARMRVQGSEAFVRFWERVLTPAERDGLGNDVDACIQSSPVNINLLCELRGWIPERAIVEIAHKIGFLTSVDYQWLRDVVGDPVSAETNFPNSPAEETPHWDRQSGRLEFRGQLCREVLAHATKVIEYLDKFEQLEWPDSILFDEETTNTQRIYDIVRFLNADLECIRFRTRKNRICWASIVTVR